MNAAGDEWAEVAGDLGDPDDRVHDGPTCSCGVVLMKPTSTPVFIAGRFHFAAYDGSPACGVTDIDGERVGGVVTDELLEYADATVPHPVPSDTDPPPGLLPVLVAVAVAAVILAVGMLLAGYGVGVPL